MGESRTGVQSFPALKLTDFAASLQTARNRGELPEVLWLAFIWVALIALWGASDDWGLTQTRRRLRRAIDVCHLPGHAHPHD